MPTPHKDSPVDLSTALREVEAGIKKLLNSGLTREAVFVLISHETGVGQKTIRQVINAATNLSKFTSTPR